MIADEGSIIPYFLTGIQKISLPNSRWSHTAAAHMHESGMIELYDTRLIGKKYFMYFENTKILRLNVFKYKIH